MNRTSSPYADSRLFHVMCGTEVVGSAGSEHTARAMAACLMSVDPTNVYYVR